MYSKLVAANDTVLSVNMSRVGMYSGRTSRYYVPNMETYFSLVRTINEEYLLDTTYVYGGYSSSTGYGTIVADEKYSFAVFADLLAESQLVKQSYEEGIQKTAWLFAKEFRTQFRPVK